jgi:hypothetical protein
MRERIGRRKRDESERRGNRLLQPTGVTQGADQSVMSVVMRGVVVDGGTECDSRFRGMGRGKQVQSSLVKGFGVLSADFGHGCD